MSDFIEIHGGRPLKGVVRISGAKNAALPMLMGTILTAEPCKFRNVPNLEDVNITVSLLEHFGATVEFDGSTLVTETPRLLASEASYSLVKALRASFWVLGPLLARGGAARVALPGGDAIGTRPVDMHLSGLSKMGADIKLKHGIVIATATKGLKPANITFDFPSVGATHQIMMAAALTPGQTVISGAAKEPEIIAVADMLTQMGAKVEGAGEDKIVIHGTSELGGVDCEIIGDRIEAGTYLLMSALQVGNSIKAQGIKPEYLAGFLPVLSQMGLDIECESDWVKVSRVGALQPVRINTGPFPALATDLQAPLMAALCFASGESQIEETIFEGRFGHISELSRMGANIEVSDRTAKIFGGTKLSGAPVEGHDIRGAASLVITALGAEGKSEIFEPLHLRRGYAGLESKLSKLGAAVFYRQSDIDDTLSIGC